MTKTSQLAIINDEALTEQDVFDAVGKVIDNLYDTGDISEATHVLNTLDRISDTSAHAKAQLLFGMSRWWQENNPNKSFTDYIESVSTKNKSTTVDRYITVQEKIESGEISDALAVRPMRDLIPIAKALAQGYTISDKNVERLIKATSNAEISDIIRAVKNKKPRKGSLQLELARDWSLYVWKNNKRTFIGWLDKEAYETHADAKEGIERLLGVGVKRK